MGRFTMPRNRRQRAVVRIPGSVFAVIALVAGDAALAQGSSSLSNNPSVTVDMSVLEALGEGPATAQSLPAPTPAPPQRVAARDDLLTPPARAPRSRLNMEALERLGLAGALAAPEAAPGPAPETPKPAATPTVAARAAPSPKPDAAPRAPDPVTITPQSQTAKTPPPRATPVPPRPAPPPAPTISETVAPAIRAAPERPTIPPAPPPAPERTTVASAPQAAETREPEAVQPASSPALQQVARATQDDAAVDDDLRVLFEPGSAKLPDASRNTLQTLSERLGSDETIQLQLVAYAAGTAETSSQARRLSLSRALAVRSFLIDKGVRSTRMDVRALGNKGADGPPDRVDVVLVQK